MSTAIQALRTWLDWLWPVDSTAESDRFARWERAGRVALVAVILGSCPVIVWRYVHDIGTDFPEYYAAGQCVLDFGLRKPNTILAYYWPSIDVAWSGLARLPMPAAAVAWCAIGWISWLGLLGAIHRYVLGGLPDLVRRRATLAAGLLVLPIAVNHVVFAAFHLLAIWWMVDGLGRIARGETYRGAWILGMAIWVKFLPALSLPYLILKGYWRSAGMAVATAVALDIVLSVGTFGPVEAWETHLQWWQKDGAGVTTRVLTSARPTPEHRFKNQSLAAVLRRVLTPLECEKKGSLRSVGLVDLPVQYVRAIYFVLLAILLGAVFWLCCRGGPATSPPQYGIEIALLALATMWCSPVAWTYYSTTVTPALAVVLAHGNRHRRLAAGVTAAWILSLAVCGWSPARAVGAMTWMTLLLGAGLGWMLSVAAKDSLFSEAT